MDNTENNLLRNHTEDKIVSRTGLSDSSVFILVLWEELPEPVLHDEPVPVKVCEVILQGGDVRLETSNSVCVNCVCIVMDAK